MNQLIIRNAKIEDSRNLFDWRNDPATRNASLSTTEIPWGDHDVWFSAALENPLIVFYISEELHPEKSQLGMCRFNISANSDIAEVSINLNPLHRGKGLARKILHECIEVFVIQFPEIHTLTATIRDENIPSMKIFLAENFLLQQTIEGIAQLELNVKR